MKASSSDISKDEAKVMFPGRRSSVPSDHDCGASSDNQVVIAWTDPRSWSTVYTSMSGSPDRSKPSFASVIAGSSHEVMEPVRIPATASGVRTNPSSPKMLYARVTG